MLSKNLNSSNEVWYPSPAKLNLMLRIVGQRDDGYHLLQTVFQFFSFSDQMRFEWRDDDLVVIKTLLSGVSLEQDLSYRAALLLRESSGVVSGVNIYNKKRLPMGGGLGGGSSNAATTLLVLNKLWKINFSFDKLATLAVQLGADVPVFVRGYAAWAEGVGEKLTKIKLPEPYCLVVFPKISVATKEIFLSSALTRDSDPITIAAFLAGGNDINDCLDVVVEKYPEVGRALKWLGQYGEARLTGTGACIFALFPDMYSAKQVEKKVPQEWNAYVGKMSNLSPLHDMLYEKS